MADLTEKLIKAEIKVNNVLRRNFETGAKLFLLKRRENKGTLEIVEEITDGWFAVFDKQFRDELKVEIATLSDISNITAQSSFLAYGVGAVDDELDVFSFERKDVVKPNATSVSWKIYTKRAKDETFVIPIGSPPDPDEIP